ncbi:hypothetical protein [Umezawaea sp. NPDC059074]|uniref:hypothetical protein n=1 Tax=Umezawaea sp. NPDC059074 TaxID=3346716 RepID=UPI00368F0006
MGGQPQIYTAAPRWVIIQWVLPDDATDVKVFRDPPPPPGTWLAGWISRDSITDQSCQPNTNYTYRVCAYYGSDEGVCSEVTVRTPPSPVTPPAPSTRPAPVINPQASMNGLFTVFLSWGEINDHNTVKLRIYREGPGGRLLRYTDPPDPRPGPPDRFSAMYWDQVTDLAQVYRYTFVTYNRDGDSTSVSIDIRVPAPPGIPRIPGWGEPALEIPHAGIGLPQVSAVSWAPDRVDVFWVNFLAPGGGVAVGHGPNPDPAQIRHAVGKPENWSAPMSIRVPNAAQGVAACSDRPGGLDVFYRNGGDLWHLRWGPESGLPEDSNDTAWGSPDKLGGTMASAPAALSVRAGRTDVFYRTPDGLLGRRWYADGQWQGEQKIPASIAGKPSAVSLNPAHLDVYYRTAANGLAHRTSLDDGLTWQDEEVLGGSVGGDPSAIALSPQRINVHYTPTAGGFLQRRTWANGRWYDAVNELAGTSVPPFTVAPFLVDFGLATVRTQPDRAYMFYAQAIPVLRYRRYR